MIVEEGAIVLVFDDSAWRAYGHDYQGKEGNDIFFRPAEIVEIMPKTRFQEALYHVRWLGGDYISRGHFATAVKPMIQPNEHTKEGYKRILGG